MITSERNIIFFITCLSLFNALFYNLFFDSSILYSDANEYNKLAKNILNGYFSLNDDYTILSMKREPLYPFFISLIYFIFGDKLFWVKFFQIIIFILTSLIVYLFVKKFINKKTAILSSILVSCLPTLANYTAFLLTESLFTFLLVVFLYLYVNSLKHNSRINFIFSGLTLGLLALTKAIMAPFVLLLFFIMIIFKKKIHISYINILIFLISFIITIYPWCYRNYKNFNTIELSLRGGDALWMSASTIDYDKKQFVQNLTYNFSEYLGSYFYPNLTNEPRDFILLRNDLYQKRQHELKLKGFKNETEIDYQLKIEAFNKIISKPHIYFFHRILELQKMLSFVYIPSLNQSHVMEYVSNYKYGNLILSLFKAPFKLFGYCIFFVSIFGMFILIKKDLRLFIIPLLIIYLNLTYSLLFGLGRYGVPLIPFYLILFSLTIINFYKNKKIK